MSGDAADLKVGSTREKAISDGRLDRALRTLIARDDQPVDVHARVMAAIDAPVDSQAGPRWRVAAAAAFCCAAVLLAAWLAMWSGARDVVAVREAKGVGRGAASGHDVRAALPHSSETYAVQTASAEHPRSRGALPRVRASPSRATDQSGDRWDAALQPLDPPDPISVEEIDAPLVQVVQLSIEHLSIDPLEVDPLDRSREE
jgi:hypothetical protein